MGCRFQMLLGHTFVFGDIGLRRKKPKKPKNLDFFFKNLGFFQPCPCPHSSEDLLAASAPPAYVETGYFLRLHLQRILDKRRWKAESGSGDDN